MGFFTNIRKKIDQAIVGKDYVEWSRRYITDLVQVVNSHEVVKQIDELLSEIAVDKVDPDGVVLQAVIQTPQYNDAIGNLIRSLPHVEKGVKAGPSVPT